MREMKIERERVKGEEQKKKKLIKTQHIFAIFSTPVN